MATTFFTQSSLQAQLPESGVESARVQVVEQNQAILAVDQNNILQLESGSAFLVAPSIDMVQLPHYQLWLAEGAAYVVAQERTTTIAAVTSPVSVTDGTSTILVPVGRQWSGASNGFVYNTNGQLDPAEIITEPIPVHFWREYQTKAITAQIILTVA